MFIDSEWDFLMKLQEKQKKIPLSKYGSCLNLLLCNPFLQKKKGVVNQDLSAAESTSPATPMSCRHKAAVWQRQPACFERTQPTVDVFSQHHPEQNMGGGGMEKDVYNTPDMKACKATQAYGCHP